MSDTGTRRPRGAKAALVATAALASLCAPTAPLYEGVSILDGTGAPLMPDMSIVVRDGRIAAVAGTDELSLEHWPEAEIEDAWGLFVIPGLIESHTHLATRADRAAAEFELNRFIYGGVTAVRDMAGDVRALAELQRAALVGEIPAPDIHYAALVAGESFFVDPRTRASSMGEVPGHVPWRRAPRSRTR